MCVIFHRGHAAALLGGRTPHDATGTAFANLIQRRAMELTKEVGGSWKFIDQSSLAAYLRKPLHGEWRKVFKISRAGEILHCFLVFIFCSDIIMAPTHHHLPASFSESLEAQAGSGRLRHGRRAGSDGGVRRLQAGWRAAGLRRCPGRRQGGARDSSRHGGGSEPRFLRSPLSEMTFQWASALAWW